MLSGSVSKELIQESRTKAQEIIKSWLSNGSCRTIDDVFNLDETALFYKLLPNKTLSDGPVEGKKICKDRLTVAVIVNATGTERTRPISFG